MCVVEQIKLFASVPVFYGNFACPISVVLSFGVLYVSIVLHHWRLQAIAAPGSLFNRFTKICLLTMNKALQREVRPSQVTNLHRRHNTKKPTQYVYASSGIRNHVRSDQMEKTVYALQSATIVIGSLHFRVP